MPSCMQTASELEGRITDAEAQLTGLKRLRWALYQWQELPSGLGQDTLYRSLIRGGHASMQANGGAADQGAAAGH